MTEDVMLKTVGKNIKNVRVEKKILQQDLAAICNIETPNMSRIENGRTNMTLKTLFKISEALGVEMYKLLLCDNSGGKKNGDKLKKAIENRLSLWLCFYRQLYGNISLI